ncbi:MAG: DUF3127 domain-containing protein [Legionellales bacterium]|nr:DUF3127 domain-containing protein [Legionellales bacterium]
MSDLTVKGRITKILPVENGTSKAGKSWEKQSFVLDTGAQYSPEVCLSLFGDKVDMLVSYGEGEEVIASFNVSSREFNSKYYHNIDCWRIQPAGGAKQPAPQIDDAPAEDDDLPF